jgi:nitroimidazol reductase NimA-like FMN-containing flavoprotein (pyridoxamine 5'-phosphate oxidase superfamily)
VTQPDTDAADTDAPDTYAPDTYVPTGRTTPTRLRERASYDRAAVHAVLDEAYICHVGYALDGAPTVLPNIHARVDDVLYLHGSTGMRLAKAARTAPVPVCVTVTLLDGLVLARSWFHHSMNYRSVVVRGEAALVTDAAERDRAFEAIVNHVVPGRAAESRPPDAKERAATAILRVPLVEVSLKHREGGVNDDEADLALPHWAGVVPLSTHAGTPVADPLTAAAQIPEHVVAPRPHHTV